MKKQLLVLLTFFLVSLSVSAQKEYKLAKNSGKLNLFLNGAIVEGYSGNEIIFSTSAPEDKEIDERAKGLRSISGSGFTDNSGLGIDVSLKGEEINVNPVSKNQNGIITIKVPQNIKVAFVSSSNLVHDEIILKNLNNEIEVSASYNKIKLENNTGPMNIKALYGSVDAIFQNEIKGPVSIISIYGYVDVSLPATVKANVELGTSYGNLYAAEGFKIAVNQSAAGKGAEFEAEPLQKNKSEKSDSFNQRFVSRNDKESLKGKINGGGADLILKSNYKNVYLRQK
ncbi:hypothetical protein [Pedobacter nototheniae]|uniref:hypothetical protein n=1 Tax=Pedobacter nototheniae TaxID=2488994 RepID=UPI00292FA8D0|nr:hypothetical protein [Pedobacter nototheniae]